jgi:hypothetical protein
VSHLKRLAIALPLVLATPPVMAQEQPTITERLQRDGSFENVVVTPYQPLRLANLVAQADLVIDASALVGKPFMTQDALDVYTDFTFRLNSMIKNMANPELTPGSVVAVRRASGTMIISGKAAITVENEFPPFERGQRYLLLLRRSREGNFFSVVGGAQGAFALAEDAKPLSVWTSDPPMRTAAFLDEVRALVKYSSY